LITTEIKIVAGDGEKQILIDGENKKLLKNFKAGFEKDYSSFETQMKKHRIPLLLMIQLQM